MNTDVNNQLDSYSKEQLQHNAPWYMAAGIGLIVLGFLAVTFAYASTLFSVVYLGFLLMIVGIFEGVHAFKVSRWGNVLLHAALSVLYIVGGFFMVMNPALNALTLTLFLAFFFMVSGIAKVIFALTKNVPHKGWLAFNGVASFIVGVMVWYQWPSSGLWVLGTFVGIDAMITGWTLVMVSLAAKRLKD